MAKSAAARTTPAPDVRTEVRDGMRIDWDVPIKMDDGLVLRADVFRPVFKGRYPVILSYGPYAKGLAFQDGYPSAWQRMAEKQPDVTAGSSNLYQSWEVVDPEKWVPHDYVCVRVDSRGAGCSPGFIDHFSPRETKDFYDCIEWSGKQNWSNGKVGLNGISYYGINQWAAREAAHGNHACSDRPTVRASSPPRRPAAAGARASARPARTGLWPRR
jgi:putative CocE/NonD family hydrolase